MNEKEKYENKIDRTLEAMQHPEKFTIEELQALLSDEECLQACRSLLDSRQVFAQKEKPLPDVEEEWNKFSTHHSETGRDESNSPEGISESGFNLSGKRNRANFARISVVLAVAASIALFFLLRTPEETSYTVFEANAVAQNITLNARDGMNTLTVPRGMKKQITLPDSTQVWLNAESSLEYPETFEGQERRVVHLKGEAFFEVSKDAAHPFIVKTDLLETQVLGTSFNVRAYSPDDAHVTLLEGSVKVKNAQQTNEILMKPGEDATLQESGKLSVNRVEEASAHNSWTKGEFYFDNTELVEIMRELGRWYNINVIFTNKEAMHYRLHFQTDRSETLPQVLDLLNCMQKVKARLENDKIIVSL